MCGQAAKRDPSYREFLSEWRGRHSKGVEMHLKQARFPFRLPAVHRRKVIRELALMTLRETVDPDNPSASGTNLQQRS